MLRDMNAADIDKKCVTRQEVAEMYDVSVDQATKIMLACPGCINVGFGMERQSLRVSRRDLIRYEQEQSRLLHPRAAPFRLIPGGRDYTA